MRGRVFSGRGVWLGLGGILLIMCWLRLGLAWGCTWTSLGLLPPLSREEVGKEGDWFWLPLCTPTANADAGQTQRRECALLLLLCFRPWSKMFAGHQWIFECLGFGFPLDDGAPTSFSSCVRKVTRLRRLSAGWISRSHYKKCPIRTSFGDQECGEGCPSTGHAYWETPFPFPDGQDVETCGENTSPFKCSPTTFKVYPMIFFKAPNSIWHLVYLGSETRHEECAREERWPRKEAKQFFSFTFFLIREFRLTLSCCWNPNCMSGPFGQMQNVKMWDKLQLWRQ